MEGNEDSYVIFVSLRANVSSPWVAESFAKIKFPSSVKTAIIFESVGLKLIRRIGPLAFTVVIG